MRLCKKAPPQRQRSVRGLPLRLESRPVVAGARDRARNGLKPQLVQLEDRQLLANFTVSNTLDSITNGVAATGSLRWAVQQAELNGGTDVINFSTTVFNTPQTIALVSPIETTASAPMITINGPGASLLTIDGNGSAFQVDSGVAAVISGMTFTKSGGSTGAIDDLGSASVSACTFAGNTTCGVYVAGTADISNCTITGNNNFSGGGVQIKGGTATITGSTLNDNTCGGGGGLWNSGTATLTDCTLSGNSSFGEGGVYNSGQLTATDCTINSNMGTGVTNKGVAYLSGGSISDESADGLYNSDQLTVKNCTISGSAGQGLLNNAGTATLSGSTISGGSGVIFGGNILNQPGTTLTLTDCTISGGTANSGAGLYNGGTATVTECTFSDNVTSGTGAGISNGPLNGSAVLVLTDSTLVDNTTPQAGGGLFNNGTATLTDDTIANNYGKNAKGAGLAFSGPTTLIACTISGNTTTQYGGGIYDSATGTNTMTLDDTIVAGNISTQTGGPVASDIAVNNASVVYGSCNFIGPGGSGGLVNGESGNIVLGALINLDLGPLADNGGPTQTMALLPGSPAIEAGENESGLTADQRGQPLDSPYPDIGAFQTSTGHASPLTFTVTSTLDDGSFGTLRWAVAQVDSTNRSATINFELGDVPETITLSQGQLELSTTGATVTITGPTARVLVSGGDASRVFMVDPNVTALISGLTIAQGSATSGGALYNQGTTSLTDCTITGSSAAGSGGGVLNDGTLTLADCTIGGDSASVGGGLVNVGTAELYSCTLSGNSSAAGGGLANAGTAELYSCTLSGNSATMGGGINNRSAANATLEDTIVAANTGAGGAPSDTGGSNAAGVTGTYDLVGTGGSGGITGSGDIVLTSLTGLGLAQLADYGGPTETIALLPGTPAIAAGTIEDGIDTDQRGESLDFPNPDIGAFQSHGFDITPVTGSTPQSAVIGGGFTNPLAVTVAPNNPAEPVVGGVVTFTVSPASNGASASLSGATAVIGYDAIAQVNATANSTLGSYTVAASTVAASPVDFALSNLLPLSFSGVAGASITFGTARVTVTGTLAGGSGVPATESVAVTLDGDAQQATIGPGGGFSTTFDNTAGLTVLGSPYAIGFSYVSDGTFASVSTTSTLTVTKAVPTVSVADSGGVYNRASFLATASVAGISGSASSSLENVDVQQSYFSGTYTSASQLTGLTPQSGPPIAAGSYTVLASFAGSGAITLPPRRWPISRSRRRHRR